MRAANSLLITEFYPAHDERPAMSVVPRDLAPSRRQQIPPLENGDHLTRVEFERRWKAMPQLKKAELLKGIVYMAAAVRDDVHGQPHSILVGWLVNYALNTPGVLSGDNSSIRIDDESMPQPDGHLRLPAQLGSTATRGADGYLEGAPDLIVEIAASSASIDLHSKRDLYRAQGVREYVVWRTIDEAVDWFVLHQGDYIPLPLDTGGWYKSQLFPGLWLHPQTLLYGFPTAIFQMMLAGHGSPEHMAFVQKLAAALK
jgi:Uma2 family endonuclease